MAKAMLGPSKCLELSLEVGRELSRELSRCAELLARLLRTEAEVQDIVDMADMVLALATLGFCIPRLERDPPNDSRGLKNPDRARLSSQSKGIAKELGRELAN
mmetsp:Transcript_360/g.587  ORF Transcript_360/g.587 Transcript_360/m.587 type:complete len:103 (-) Transcript_360:395-703(-)